MVNLPESRAYTLHFRNKPRFHLPCIMNLRLSRVFLLLSPWEKDLSLRLRYTYCNNTYSSPKAGIAGTMRQPTTLCLPSTRKHVHATVEKWRQIFSRGETTCWSHNIITDLPGRTSKTSREKGSLATRPQRSLLLNIKIKTLNSRGFHGAFRIHVLFFFYRLLVYEGQKMPFIS